MENEAVTVREDFRFERIRQESSMSSSRVISSDCELLSVVRVDLLPASNLPRIPAVYSMNQTNKTIKGKALYGCGIYSVDLIL